LIELSLATDREALSLALLFDRSARLDATLLLLELVLLLVQLFPHLAMTGVQLLFALLELVFLLLDLLLEDHLHLALHLLQLLLVQRAFLLLLGCRVDLLEDRRILLHAHRLELARTVVLVERVVGVFFELLHVCSDEHLTELGKVAVILVVNLDDSPRVLAATHFASFGGADLGVGADNGEGNLRHDLLVLGDCLFVVQLVAGALENLDALVFNICENLVFTLEYRLTCLERQCTHSCLEGDDLLISECVGLGDDRDQVDLGVESAHDLNVERLKRVTGGLNKVHAGMDTVVDDVHAVDLVLGIEVGIKALLDVLDNGTPGLVVVDKVTKSRSINDVQSQTYTILFNVCTDGLDGNGGGCEVEAGLFLLLGWVERSVEQCVDKSRLSKTRFT
jgi:hypothetical protein